MRRRAGWGAIIAIAALASAMAARAAPARVEGIRIAVDGDETRLVVRLDASSDYRMFTLPAPDRVVLDIDSARLAASALPLPPGAGLIRQLRVANRTDGAVRVVIDLAAPVEPRGALRRASGRDADEVVVALSSRRSPPVAVASTAPTPVNSTAATVPPPEPVPATGLAGAAPEVAPMRRVPAPAAEADAVAPAAEPRLAPPPAAPVAAEGPPRSRSTAEPSPLPGRDIVIAVDAGHGGKDPGAHGPRGVLEKDVTLRIARRLVEVINEEPGMRGVLTRSRDEFIPLRGRMERARAANADLFVSIHADAVRNRRVQGASVYVLNDKGATDEAARRLAARENAADLIGGVSLGNKDRTLASVLLDLSQNASLSSSVEVADEILAQIARVGVVRKPRVMQAPFMVLKSPDVPSVLVETAYISNPEEERRLDSRVFRNRMAGAIFAGVRDYFYRNPPRGTLVAELSRRSLAAGDARHVIRPGESLAEIASRYNTSVRQLRDVNRLKGDRVNAGQVLRIPSTRET